MKREKVNNITFLDNYTDPIIVKKGLRLKAVDLMDKDCSSQSLNREFIIEEGASLEYLKLSLINENCSLDINYEIDLQKDAKLAIHLFELGSGNTINKLKTVLNKYGESIFINSLVKSTRNTTVLNDFHITHMHPNTYSDLQVSHLLDDKAKAEFTAKTIIENDALYSKAFQNSKTILLSDDAIIKASPHLEIFVDELEASHGAVTGGLDEQSLYYLRSRGLNELEAKNILIDAFCFKVLDNIEDESLKSWITEVLKDK